MLGVFLSDVDLDRLLATLSQLSGNKARKLALHAISDARELPVEPKAPAPAPPSSSPLPSGPSPGPSALRPDPAVAPSVAAAQ